MKLDISKTKKGLVVTRVGGNQKEVVEKRYVTYKEKDRELKLEYRLEHTRYVDIRESNNYNFKNAASGCEIKIEKIENGLRTGVASATDVEMYISQIVYKITDKILRGTVRTDIYKYIEKHKKENKTNVLGITYDLRVEEVLYKGIVVRIPLIELKIKEIDVELEDKDLRRKMLKNRMTGVDISVSGKMTLESLMKTGYDEKECILNIYGDCKGYIYMKQN